jgi:hypothetical protein
MVFKNTTDDPLLPCPFCGGEPRIEDTDDGAVFVNCSKCLASSKCCYGVKTDPIPTVVEAWNTRVRIPFGPREYEKRFGSS